MALLEDAPWGDLTSQTLIPEGAADTAELVAREAGVLSGADVFRRRDAIDGCGGSRPSLRFADGERFAKGDVLATVEGPARGCCRRSEWR